jgi:hypothetical protein
MGGDILKPWSEDATIRGGSVSAAFCRTYPKQTTEQELIVSAANRRTLRQFTACCG